MAATQSLKDEFNGTALNTSLWAQFLGGSATITYAVSGAQVNFPASSTSSTDGDLTSNTTYSLISSYAYMNVVTVASAATSADCVFKLSADATNYVRWVYEAGTLFAQYVVAGATNTPFSVAYAATMHTKWRIREAQGITYWDTWSSDSGLWTNRAAIANPITLTALTAQIAGVCFQAETNPGTFKWKNFNVGDNAVKFNNSGLRPHPFSPGLAR